MAVSTTERSQNLALTQGKDASSVVPALAVAAGLRALYADAQPRGKWGLKPKPWTWQGAGGTECPPESRDDFG